MNPFLRDTWPFLLVWALYIVGAGWVMLAGYGRELTGWRHPGRPSRVHMLLFQIHTGRNIDTRRTYGDEARLKRAVGVLNRATPEGQLIYFHPWQRWQRILRNNLIVLGFLTAIAGMMADTQGTLRWLTIAACTGIGYLIFKLVRHVRRVHAARNPVTYRPKNHKPITKGKKAQQVMQYDELTLNSTPVLDMPKPTLTSEVPISVVAGLLAEQMGCSSAEMQRRLTLGTDAGQVVLPDRFAALIKQREPIQEIITAHTDGRVSFRWLTTVNPRVLTWKPVVSGLPVKALFRDYLSAIQACRPGEFAVGPDEDKKVYIASHNGDRPWHCTSAGSGTGKSTRFLVKAAQIAHNDPEADIYCVDTKQISFEHLHNIPGIHIFDNPQSDMRSIWNVFYEVEGIMRDRYKAVREGRMTMDDFNNIWMLVDEGNDLQGNFKSYWNRRLKKAGDASAPPIWGEAVAPLLRLGRQAKVRGEWMLQDVTDKALGGESLKMAFSEFAMADWKKSQWDRIIGPPCPPCIAGPGKIMMVRGTSQTWVQGFIDDPEYLRQYAMANRKERAA